MKHPIVATPLLPIRLTSAFEESGPIENLRLLIGSVCAALIFSWLTSIVRSDHRLAIDAPGVLQALHGHQWILEKLALIVCTSVGVVGLSIFVLLIYRRMLLSALFWFCAISGGGVIENFFKKLIQRPRPEFADVLMHQSSFAFPSGHAIQSAAIVLAALLLFGHDAQRRKKLLVLGSIFLGLVGLSRLYLGAHYPSDVLAGWALATTWVLALAAVFDLPATPAWRKTQSA